MINQESQKVPQRFDNLKTKWSNFKYKAELFLHGVFWRFLWATRLAVPYSKVMCRLSLYRKFPDGRCMYCGKVH